MSPSLPSHMRSLIALAVIILSARDAPAQRHLPTAAAVDLYLERLVPFGFAGAVHVSVDGRTVVKRGDGHAERETGRDWTPSTVFDIGSITKQFTAAAILQLEIEGRLAVEDSIGRFFGGVPEDKRGITLHQLLTHTSGMVGGFGGDYERVSRDEIVRRSLEEPLRSNPGTRHHYSNAGYSLLAAVVELASGMRYDSYLRARFLDPLGMRSTGYFPADAMNREAIGYQDERRWGTGLERAAPLGWEFWNLIGNGGLHSTNEDMHRWMRALAEGSILNAEARHKFVHPHVVAIPNYRGSGSPLHYTYGWYHQVMPGDTTLIWHHGGNGIFNAAARWYVERGTILLYATNIAEFGDHGSPVAAIERMIAGSHVSMPPVTLPIDSAAVAILAGEYADDDVNRLHVTAEGEVLTITGEGQSAFSFARGHEWTTQPVLDSLNARAAAIIRASHAERYLDILPALGFAVTLDSLQAFERRFWQRRVDRHGHYKATRALGTIPGRVRVFPATTIVAIDMEHGTVYREYIWSEERKVVDLGPLDRAPMARFRHIGDSCFASFDAAMAHVSSVCISRKPDDRHVLVASGEPRVRLMRRVRPAR